MSCYEWMRGSYKLPAKEYSKFKKGLVEFQKLKLDSMYTLAKDIARNNKTVNKRLDALDKSKVNNYWEEVLKCSMVSNGKTRAVVKADFKLNKFEDDCLLIRLDDTNKTVHISVEDNNHSVDAAENTDLWGTFWKLLNKVEFSCKSGGYVKYYSEYHADDGEGATILYPKGKYIKAKYVRKI